MGCTIIWYFNTTEFTAYCVFYVGLQFCLRGVQEHNDLVLHQFTRFPADITIYDNSVYHQYAEVISKNNKHKFQNNDMRNKQVRTNAFPGSDRCLVKVIDMYLTKLVPKSEHSYMCLLPTAPTDDMKPWYTRQSVRVNTIKQFCPIFTEEVYQYGYFCSNQYPIIYILCQNLPIPIIDLILYIYCICP